MAVFIIYTSYNLKLIDNEEITYLHRNKSKLFLEGYIFSYAFAVILIMIFAFYYRKTVSDALKDVAEDEYHFDRIGVESNHDSLRNIYWLIFLLVLIS